MPAAPTVVAKPRHKLRLALVVVVLALAAVGGTAAGLARFDAGFLKARLEASVLHATGRTLEIDGPIHLTLLPAPGITAAGVALGNVAGGSRPVMVRAASVQATVDPLALLSRHVLLRSLVLVRPDILLERTADGRPNWVFTPSARPAAPGGGSAPGARFRLSVSSLAIDGGRLTWAHVRRPGDGGTFAIDHLFAQQHDAASSFTLALAGRHGAAPFQLSLASASPVSLAAAGPAHPFPVRASLRLGGATPGEGANGTGQPPDVLAMDGQFADPLHGRGFTGVVHASLRATTDLAALFPHAGLPAVRDLVLGARVAQDPGGRWAVSSLSASLGAADAGRLLPGLLLAHATVVAPDATAPVAVHAAGTLRGQAVTLDAPALGSLQDWSGTGSPAAPIAAPLDVVARAGQAQASLRGSITPGGDGSRTLAADDHLAVPDPAALASLFGRSIDRHVAVVTDGHLTLERTAGGREMSGALDLERLLLDGAVMPPTRVAFARTPGGLASVKVSEAGDAPWLTWNGNIAHEPVDWTLVLDGHRVPAPLVAAIAGAGRGIGGTLDLTGSLQGVETGGTVDPARLVGDWSATLIDGTLRGEAARALLGPALGAIHLPLGAGGLERLRCAGAEGRVGGGTVTLASLSLDSRLLAAEGSGTVGLPGGALALHLRPVVRLGPAAASAPMLVGGTLDAPTASLAHDQHGRVALSIGGGGGAEPARVACDANPDVAALPAARRPRAADILRSLGLFR